jgi:glycosyltransferase involved in cell wall biosynthesis
MNDISVVLPVYTAGPPLELAIRSILQQTRKDFELVIVDDCSKDQSAQMIRQFEKQDSRIRAIYHQTNQGLSNTLNETLRIASGKYVVRMDQDDESLPDRLEKQIGFLEAHPKIAVVGSYVYHMGARPEFDRLVTMPVSHQEISAALPRYNCIYHPSIAMRRRWILALGGYRGEFRNAEDYDLWLRVSRIHQIANLPEPLLRYRFSVSGMTLSNKWEQYYYVQLAQLSYLKPDVALASLFDEAKARREEQNRQVFMEGVHDGTIRELVALKHWSDALALAKKSIRELGWRSGTSKYFYVLKSWTRNWARNRVIPRKIYRFLRSSKRAVWR